MCNDNININEIIMCNINIIINILMCVIIICNNV